MKPAPKISSRNGLRVLAFSIVALFAVGGFFFPLLGLGVPALMLVALVMNFRGRRSFCAGVCPNGTFLAATLRPASRNKRVPSELVRPQFRRMLCGAMMFCMIGLIIRGYPDPVAIGRSFWLIYLIALSLGVVFGFLYKPRAWCTFCPMGTLQDTIGDASKRTR